MLNTLKTRYEEGSTRMRIKTVVKAQSDKDEITSCTQKLEDSFRHFMVCVPNHPAGVTNTPLELCHEFHRSSDIADAGRNSSLTREHGSDESEHE